MVASPAQKPSEPGSVVQGRRVRHLKLVPHHHAFADEDARRVSESRWFAALIAIATAAMIGLWAAAMYTRAGEAPWWSFLLAGVVLAVAVFGTLAAVNNR